MKSYNRSHHKNISTKVEEKEEQPIKERKVIKVKILNEKNEMSEEYEKKYFNNNSKT